MSDLILVIIILGIMAVFFVFIIIHSRRVVPYIYSSAKISAWEAKLLTEGHLFEFADSVRVMNVLAGLDDTDYRSYLSDIPRVEKVDVLAVERGLKRNLCDRYQELLKVKGCCSDHFLQVSIKAFPEIEVCYQGKASWHYIKLRDILCHFIPLPRSYTGDS